MYFVYIVQCDDGTLYTGITSDINRRIEQHNNGNGAKYTRVRTPVKLVYMKEQENRSVASKEEYRIKQLTRAEKLKLIDDYRAQRA